MLEIFCLPCCLGLLFWRVQRKRKAQFWIDFTPMTHENSISRSLRPIDSQCGTRLTVRHLSWMRARSSLVHAQDDFRLLLSFQPQTSVSSVWTLTSQKLHLLLSSGHFRPTTILAEQVRHWLLRNEVPFGNKTLDLLLLLLLLSWM